MRVSLNVGRPATVHPVAGFRTPEAEEAAEIKRSPHWAPNMEPDTILACGCRIPWPIISLLGKQPGRGNHGDVWCETHQRWMNVAEKEKVRARKGMKSCKNAPISQSSLQFPTDPPF